MKRVLMLTGAIALTACAAQSEKPHGMGMANPASVYCQKVGGKLDVVTESGGQVGYCTLPSGERIEQWALYRRDNPKQ